MLEDRTLGQLASLATPLPPVSNDQIFTAQQWQTLISICEVFIPDLSTASSHNIEYAASHRQITAILPPNSPSDLAITYLAETVADNAAFQENIRRRFAAYIPASQRKGLAFLLSALDTRIGCLGMTGSTVSLHAQTLPTRSRIVLNWATAYLAPLRALYQAGESLTKATWLAQSDTLHRVLGFPEVPEHIIRETGFGFSFLDFNDPKILKEGDEGQDEDQTIHLEADVVIVGSGCGAGVVAEHLATTLHDLQPRPRILVVEKGYHFPSSHFPMSMSAVGVNLFESGGAVLSDDSSIGILAGSTWGGGGTVNWSASLQPTHIVREEWAIKHGLPFFQSQTFQDCLDEVCQKMGVCSVNDHEGLSKIQHNFANKTLLEGARRLGLAAEVVPQNTAGKVHNCGRCSMGCASATKQGPANYWLPRAAEHSTLR